MLVARVYRHCKNYPTMVTGVHSSSQGDEAARSDRISASGLSQIDLVPATIELIGVGSALR